MYVRKLAAVVVTLVIVVGMSSCTKWGEKTKPTWKSATSGEQLTNLFWQDVKAKNWKSLESRMAPIIVAMSAGSVSDRAGVLEHVKAINIESFQIGEVRTEPAGPDLIVTYVITVRGTVGDRPFPATPIRMMSVWQQVRDGYILVAHATMPAAQ